MNKPLYNRKTVRVSAVLLLCFGILQLYRPELKKQPVTADFNGPENVKAILKAACYDCHSNEPDFKWFDHLQPAYSIALADSEEGKAGLNFSEWGNMAPGDQKAKLFEILNQITTGSMPLKSYQVLHRSANLNPAEIAIVKNYVAGMIKDHPADTALVNAATKQFNNWNAQNLKADKLPETLTGVPYLPDYKNWQVVSTTDRMDNNTIRVVFGNPIAIKAIAEHHINPWPEGTIFAKVAWDKLLNADGNVKTGAFKQVEYMIKDSEKYKRTKGWGWARFKTMKLLPYGKNIGYATECVNCHRPLSNNDFVFTLPVKH